MPSGRLRKFGRRIAVGIAGVVGLGAVMTGHREPPREPERPVTAERHREEGRRPFSLDRLLLRQERLYSREKHLQSAEFHKKLVGRMFIAGKLYYKRHITSIRQLEEILKTIHSALDTELPAIVRGEGTILDFQEAYSKKKRDCDIGTILFLETLRMMGLKNVDFFYGHRYSHGFLYVKLDGRNYRFETMSGKVEPLLPEDVAIDPMLLENYFQFITEYSILLKRDKGAAIKLLGELVKRDHIYELDYTYGVQLFGKDVWLARQHLKKAYEKSKYAPRIGLEITRLELTQGDFGRALEILQKLRIPDPISEQHAKLVFDQIIALRGFVLIKMVTNLEMKKVFDLLNALKKRLDSVQKVY